MALPGVVGVGIGERDRAPCILVLVEEATSEITERIPRRISGHPVEIEESGPIYAV